MAKSIRGFLENLFEYYFLNIIVNVNFFNNLKFEYYCEYYPEIQLKVSLKWETEIDGRGHEIFSENIPGQRIFFKKICKTLQSPILHT